jgi:hypothetical protein
MHILSHLFLTTSHIIHAERITLVPQIQERIINKGSWSNL